MKGEPSNVIPADLIPLGRDLSIAAAGAVFALLGQYVVRPLVTQYFVTTGEPVFENPYASGDYTRDMPKRLRFLRLPVSMKFGTLRNAEATMDIEGADTPTGEIDHPGLMHWARQPRSGHSHPARLHEELETAEDVVRHMHDHHFAHNRPIDIQARPSDPEKLDLLMCVEDYPKAITTINRENGLQPGEYTLTVEITADNLLWPVEKQTQVRVGGDFEDVEVVAEGAD